MLTNLKQKGYTLVELMVAMALGLVVVAGVSAAYLGTLRTNADSLKMMRLNEELRAIMTLMVRDIRRAGQWGVASEVVTLSRLQPLSLSSASSGTGRTLTVASSGFQVLPAASSVSLPFLHIVEDPTGTFTRYTGTVTAVDANADNVTATLINDFPGTTLDEGSWLILSPFREFILTDDANGDSTADDPCILFDYDRTDNGTPGEHDGNDEQFGYRLEQVSGVGVIKEREAGGDCDDSGWQALSDDKVVDITEFTITDLSQPSLSASLSNLDRGLQFRARTLQLSITGKLISDSTVERTLSAEVHIRNNHYE